jgi:hypothetical protein
MSEGFVLNPEFVNVSDSGCWLWSGPTRKGGYAAIRYKKKLWTVVRLLTGAKKGETVRHTCDNPNCVNPSHLVKGTQKQNVQDCLNRGRFKPFIPKLNPHKARVIKKLFSLTDMSNKEISLIFKVTPEMIARIRRGYRWAKV